MTPAMSNEEAHRSGAGGAVSSPRTGARYLFTAPPEDSQRKDKA